jgi:hypothetical protein
VQSRKFRTWFLLLPWCMVIVPSYTQEVTQLTVLEVMNDKIVPASSTLWSAFEIETEAQWAELESAANTLIQAGEMLSLGGAGTNDKANAANTDWQEFNQQMIAAAHKMLSAISTRNEEALSAAGNDDLYPPCENCHARYMAKQ